MLRSRWRQRVFFAASVAAPRRDTARARMSERAKQIKPAEIMDVTPAAVEQAFRGSGCTRMIHGHTHRPARHIHLVDGRRQRWVLSDWYQHGRYLQVGSTAAGRGAHLIFAALTRNLRGGFRLACLPRRAPVLHPDSRSAGCGRDRRRAHLSRRPGGGGRRQPFQPRLPGAFCCPADARRILHTRRSTTLPWCCPARGRACRRPVRHAGRHCASAGGAAGWIDVSEGSGYYVYYWSPYIWWLLTAGFAALYLTHEACQVAGCHYRRPAGVFAALVDSAYLDRPAVDGRRR